MARAATETLMPLDTWAKVMQINPYEFNQLGTGFPKVNRQSCDHVWFQYSYQQDFLSREELAQTIQMAEFMVAQQLGFFPAPKYILDEPQQYPRPARRELWGGGVTPRGQLKAVQLNWEKVQGGGVLARTQINAAAAVIYSDPDGDSVKELFTVVQATTITDPNEIALYFKAADRNGEDIAETWRIRPVKVSISGGTATITGHAALLVLPDKELAYNAAVLDVTDSANFVTEVEVSRVYRDDSYDSTANTSKQGYAMWENLGCQEPPCAVQVGALCIGARDPVLGFVSVNFTVNPECHDVAPDRLSISYLAGEPLVNGQMSPDMADIVAHLATAMLPVEKCGCERSNRIIAYWRESAPSAGEGLRERLTGLSDDGNPFGPQRGAIYAWNKVKLLRSLA